MRRYVRYYYAPDSQPPPHMTWRERTGKDSPEAAAQVILLNLIERPTKQELCFLYWTTCLNAFRAMTALVCECMPASDILGQTMGMHATLLSLFASLSLLCRLTIV